VQQMITVQCWTGAETKALRQAMRLSIRAFAAHLGIDARTINKWEARHTTITLRPHTQELMDTALQQAPEEVQTRFTQTMHNTQQGQHQNATQPATPVHDPAPGADFLPPSSGHNDPDNSLTESSPYSCIIALRASSQDVAMMQAFRSADLQVGGGHLYASVVNYLQSEVGPRLVGDDDDTESNTIFTAAAALTEMAGWMAHDAGRDETAKQHFGRSLALVKIGGDHQLGAHVLGSMSHLANHLSQPDEAIALARQGQAVLHNAAPHPDLEARLLAMEARGFAGLQESSECIKLLIRAEKALDTSPTESPSPWISHFDMGSLASEAARCMRQLGDWAEAQRQAEQIVRLRSSNRTRSRALGQLTLVAALIEQQKPDEACAIAQEVINFTQSLSSFLVIEQLLELQRLLQSHRANSVVGEFVACLNEALHARQWLYRWLAKDRRRFNSGH